MLTIPPSTMMFWPMLGMATLTALALAAMARRRLGAVSRREVPLDEFKGDRDPELPASSAVATRHFANHFEVPVLFHVVCLLHLHFSLGGYIAAALAWGFVVFRALHMREHLGRNDVRTRFRLYAVSTMLVFALWLELALRLVIA